MLPGLAQASGRGCCGRVSRAAFLRACHRAEGQDNPVPVRTPHIGTGVIEFNHDVGAGAIFQREHRVDGAYAVAVDLDLPLPGPVLCVGQLDEKPVRMMR